MSPDEVKRYLRDHPDVYIAFEREAVSMIRRGFKHYSARTIMEYLRHHSALEADPTKTFKINDHLIPELAREFMRQHPQWGGFFELRASKLDYAAYAAKAAAIKEGESDE